MEKIKIYKPSPKEYIKDVIMTVFTITAALVIVFLLDNGISSWLDLILGVIVE